MKMILTILNVISAIPILVYPFLLIAGVMSFAAPGGEKSWMAWMILIVSLGYPLLIIALIFLSRKYDSISLALAALIPLLVLVYFFFISGGTTYKDDFNTLPRDFICDSNSFLSLGGTQTSPIRGLYLLEKKNFFTYTKDVYGANVYGNKWVNIKDRKISLCKNSEGKTPAEVYIQIPNEQIKDILKQF